MHVCCHFVKMLLNPFRTLNLIILLTQVPHVLSCGYSATSDDEVSASPNVTVFRRDDTEQVPAVTCEIGDTGIILLFFLVKYLSLINRKTFSAIDLCNPMSLQVYPVETSANQNRLPNRASVMEHSKTSSQNSSTEKRNSTSRHQKIS